MTYRDMTQREFDDLKSKHNNFAKDEDREILEKDLTAVGIWGIQDPLRDSIKESIS